MEHIDGKWLALLLVGQRAAVGADQDCVVFAGMARITPEGGYLLDRGPDYQKINLRDEWLDRLQAVPPERRSLVHNADFVLPLVVDALPGNEDLEKVRPGQIRERDIRMLVVASIPSIEPISPAAASRARSS